MNPGPLHILTDTRLQQRHDAVALAAMAFLGGANVVQYREKFKPDAVMKEEVERIMRLPRAAHQRLVVNDHVSVARLSQGVHLGAEDLSPAEARLILGDAFVIGATVHSLAELAALEGGPIDYIGVGPVFGTTSKDTGLPPLGLKGLEEIAAASPWPVIAIGGITLQNVRDVRSAGAYGVAVLSEFCLAPEPERVAAAFAHILA
jgi:thiamine-phosphate pyrophosphorylase